MYVKKTTFCLTGFYTCPGICTANSKSVTQATKCKSNSCIVNVNLCMYVQYALCSIHTTLCQYVCHTNYRLTTENLWVRSVACVPLLYLPKNQFLPIATTTVLYEYLLWLPYLPATMLRFSRDPGGQGLAPRGARPGGRHLMPRLRRSRARGTATCACRIVEPGVRNWPNCWPICKTAYRSVEIMGTRSCLHKL